MEVLKKNMYKILLLCLLVGIIVGSDIGFDVLAIKKCQKVQDWSIHGLWPEYNKTSWPQFCNVTKEKDFNYKNLSPVYHLLVKYWYSCIFTKDTNDWIFWRHEWDKHGTCQPLNILDYFNSTINLFLNLQENGIVDKCCPSTHQSCMIPVNFTSLKWLGYCF